MGTYIIDSWAWMEYIQGTDRGKKVHDLIKKGEPVFSGTITIAEVSSKLKRRGLDFTKGRDAITSNSKVISLDENLAYEAGQIHAEMRKNNPDFGMADAIILTVARQLNAKILTGDPDFKDVKEAVMI